MPVLPLSDLPDGPLLGLDPGSKTIGVAACGAGRTMATSVETILRTKMAQDAARLFALYDERGAAAIIMGLPVNMDGTEGPRAQSARAMARNILSVRDVPLSFQDERLSSHEAEDRLIAAGIRKDKRKAVIDAEAAAVILQAALDRMTQL